MSERQAQLYDALMERIDWPEGLTINVAGMAYESPGHLLSAYAGDVGANERAAMRTVVLACCDCARRGSDRGQG